VPGAIGVRWTIGDVSAQGFAALRLSIWGAARLFGPRARYLVGVNTVEPAEAARRCGAVPAAVEWRRCDGDVPAFLLRRLDEGFAEGVAWKLAPVRLFPDAHELALDNDCILWSMPPAVAAWLGSGERRGCLLAADVQACFGQFADLCGAEPRNSGLRGLPPGLDFEAELAALVGQRAGILRSELDEQGLQVAAVRASASRVDVVAVDDVSICSPFPPHVPSLGRCGAHFVGLNVKSIAWQVGGRPADQLVRELWSSLYADICARVGCPPAR
jgi:hypothetical protein